MTENTYFNHYYENGDNTMDYDFKEPHKQDDLKAFSFKAKGAPKDGLTYSHGTDFAKDKENWSVKHKTELTNDCKDCNTKIYGKASLKDMEVKIAHQPSALNKDGVKACFHVESTCNPAAENADIAVKGCFGNVKMGPLDSWTTVNLKRDQKTTVDKANTQNKTSAISYSTEFTQNFFYENKCHFGFRCDYDFSAKKLDAAYGALSYVHKDFGTWYFRSNCLNRFVGLGVHKHCGDKRYHVAEVQYDFSEKPAVNGLFGKPLFLRIGG